MSAVIIRVDQWARLFWGLVEDGTILVHDGIEFTASCEDLTVPAWGIYKRVLVLTAKVNASPMRIHPLGLTSQTVASMHRTERLGWRPRTDSNRRRAA